MLRQAFLVFLLFLIGPFSGPLNAAGSKQPLELFGVPLKGADRAVLRAAFVNGGMVASREDRRYWVDAYEPNGVLEGASEFRAAYVMATGKFAYAEYVFKSFMNTRLVADVIGMVSSKYGRPTYQSGNYNLGEVSAKWVFAQGMQIDVVRGWPDTTTVLRYSDTAAHRQMRAEMDAEKSFQQQKKMTSQSNAF